MSTASLSKFTVPLPSDQSATTQGLLMPKLQYRFGILFQNFGVSTPTTELTKQVIDANRPSVSFTPITIDVYNSKVKLNGRHEWQDMKISLRDDVTGQVQKLVGEQIQKQFDFYEQASAASGIDYKFTTKIEMLDGGNGAFEPVVLETWELYGCFIKDVAYGELGYGKNEVAKIDLTLVYDNAVQSPQGTGVGANVGRTNGTMVTGAGR